MAAVNFKFKLDEFVEIQCLDVRATGIIEMLGIDDSGQIYYVKTAEGGNWWKECQLHRG